MKNPDASVGGVRLPLEQSKRFQLVDDAGERNRLDVEKLGEAALIDTLVSGEVSQDLPLRTREARPACVLLESLSQEPRDIVQQEAESRLIIPHRRAVQKP
jgi:hypothetical protein